MLEMTGNGRLPKEDLFAEIPDQKPGQQASQTPGPVDAKGTSRPSAETSAAKRFIVPANPAKTVV